MKHPTTKTRIVFYPPRVPLAHEQMQQATRGLDQLVHCGENLNHHFPTTCESVMAGDLNGLDEGRWFTDAMMNFLFAMIAGSDTFFCFRTDFFTTLEKRGNDSVEKWTWGKRRRVDIFGKTITCIPIHTRGHHWCLAVILNAGSVLGRGPPGAQPCILFVDSRSANARKGDVVGGLLRSWLNHEFRRRCHRAGQPFTEYTMPLFLPTFPQQSNGNDCGVYTIKAVYAFYKLRNNNFTRDNPWFLTNLKKHPEFQNWQTDVAHFRAQVKTLISRLASPFAVPLATT